jgi:hypothetical protein
LRKSFAFPIDFTTTLGGYAAHLSTPASGVAAGEENTITGKAQLFRKWDG